MTILTTISDDYSPGYYVEGYDDDPWSSGTIAGRGKLVSEVAGDLADRVRARVGSEDGVVTLIEDHYDIGYCVTCSSEEVDFEVQVDGDLVFRTQYATSGSEIYGAEAVEFLNGYAQFNNWLNGGDPDDRGW
jgi:hypothetical protein